MDNIKEKLQEVWNSWFYKTEDSAPKNDLEEYKRKIRRAKEMRYFIIAGVVIAVVLGGLILKFVIDSRSYDGYRVVETSEQLDSSILHYEKLGDYVLKYSGDGVSLLNAADEALWNDSILMTAPKVESFGDYAAIYEANGTIVYIYGIDGKVGEITTQYPILKASVSGIGGVAVLLENGKETLMNYYASDGSLIAASSSNMKNPGYPIDLSLSEDGMMMAISYFAADGDTISSFVAFYNFDEAGKNKEDNLVDGYRYDGVLVPELQYLDEDTLVAYCDNGFIVYRGTEIVTEDEKVQFEKEIVSAFRSEDLFGFVFTGTGDKHAFELKLYNKSGKLQMETGFGLIYDKIKVSENEIILYNANQLAVIADNGTERFCGDFQEGAILDVVKRGLNRYTVATSKGLVTIVLD